MCDDFKGNWSDHLSLIEFPYNNIYQSRIGMAPYEALYGIPCRTPLCWAEVSERSVIGPHMVQETTEKIGIIQDRLRTAQSRQKSYADVRKRPLEFQIGENVFLRVSPRPGIKRFGKKSKLAPRYIGTFEILQRIGEVAYPLALPTKFADIHNVFHVSMLCKYNADPSHIIEWRDLQLNDNVSYEEKPLRVVDSKEQVLRSKTIKTVKVLWQHHGSEEATWELESEIRDKYL
ncbi:uncharacterized protein LOC113324326 [Papaver somniferum]|uniref:uncharacterized protein LOC113324326 n=1 Tax=Papaver somniferum TaxID=3469 RepID=UPI000E701694|nr:uncharacterized protein LOC113324326 [Papaver somniferum]